MEEGEYSEENILRSLQMECNTDTTHKCKKGAHQEMILAYKDVEKTKRMAEKTR